MHDFTAGVLATDCNGVSVTQTPTAVTIVALGVTVVTLLPYTALLRSSTCTANFTVTDNTAPSITTCAADQNAFAKGSCGALVTDFKVGVVATDCNGVSGTQTPTAGTSVALGVTVVTLHVKAAALNEST